jgi:hypothetical protein
MHVKYEQEMSYERESRMVTVDTIATVNVQSLDNKELVLREITALNMPEEKGDLLIEVTTWAGLT